jgi:site-specific DNA-cytosine methylase
MAKPLCIDLFCGLGGWSHGFLAEGWDCVGFDIERHQYPAYAMPDEGTKLPTNNSAERWADRPVQRLKDAQKAGVATGGIQQYPAQLVLQDVLTLDGSQFRNAACIVASPPCQEYSYMAMPWKRAKQIAQALRGKGEFPEDYAGSRTTEQLTALFNACFRIQREASEAAGRYIPLVVENVKGAQPWAGRARAHFGSYYLWGDVESVGGRIVAGGLRFGQTLRAGRAQMFNPGSWFKIAGSKNRGVNGQKGEGGAWFNDYKSRPRGGLIERLSCTSSHSSARKAASAQIAEIPFALASYIARSLKPQTPTLR